MLLVLPSWSLEQMRLFFLSSIIKMLHISNALFLFLLLFEDVEDLD